jgi:uncharacterized membrane protein YbhN (UPF0104 family)
MAPGRALDRARPAARGAGRGHLRPAAAAGRADPRRGGARIRFRLAADVVLATFFVSHLTPFGSATGTLVNASALEADGIAAATTGEAIALTSLTSTIALIVLFGTGLVATVGRHVSRQYLVIAGVALFLVVAALAGLLAVGAHLAIAGRAGRWAASVAKRVRPGIDPVKAGQASSRLAALARTALTGRDFLISFGFASGDLLFDLLSLDLVFLALRYQPGFGPLAVAYAAANIASAIPLTPAGWASSRSRWWPSPSASARRGPRRCWPCSATGS